jgi:hypothetical protein
LPRSWSPISTIFRARRFGGALLACESKQWERALQGCCRSLSRNPNVITLRARGSRDGRVGIRLTLKRLEASGNNDIGLGLPESNRPPANTSLIRCMGVQWAATTLVERIERKHAIQYEASASARGTRE